MSDNNLLIKISTDLATNTQATRNIEEHLVTLNGKVATHSKELSILKRNLLVIGTMAGTLLLTNGSELINFIMKLLL